MAGQTTSFLHFPYELILVAEIALPSSQKNKNLQELFTFRTNYLTFSGETREYQDVGDSDGDEKEKKVIN